jgi:hypothetical protein
MGAFFAPQKTGLCGAPHGNLRLPRSGPGYAVAAPHPSNPLRSSTSGKPEVNMIHAWSFATQNSRINCRNAVL